MFLPTSAGFTIQLDLHPQSVFGKGYMDLTAFLLSKSSCSWLCPDLLNHHPAKLTAEKEDITEEELESRGCGEGVSAGLVMDILWFCLVREKLRFK